MTYDYAVLGGGIVGLSVARELLRVQPDARLILIEKESGVAQHQSGRNSGVLHTGIYYKPGSFKAANCVAGKQKTEAFCRQNDIPFETCGKLIVAVDEAELPVLEMLAERGRQNGVNCRVISREEALEREPHIAVRKAILVPEAGIVDYRQVCRKLQELIEQAGCQTAFNFTVRRITQTAEGFVIAGEGGEYRANYLINCCGLYSDDIARKTGAAENLRIIPFRGEYYALQGDAKQLCRHLIYPVPDLNFPFLGVHFTRMIDGKVECGPNAVLAAGKEAYHRSQIHFRELADILKFRGFHKIALRYGRQGLAEMYRSFSKAAFLRSAQRLIPALTAADIVPAPAGIRAQAVSVDGKLIDDFNIFQTPHSLHVLNAPSPAATSAPEIADALCKRLQQQHGPTL